MKYLTYSMRWSAGFLVPSLLAFLGMPVALADSGDELQNRAGPAARSTHCPSRYHDTLSADTLRSAEKNLPAKCPAVAVCPPGRGMVLSSGFPSVCSFEDADHCQLADLSLDTMYLSDRSAGGGCRADDFTPLSDTITSLCWTAGFYNPDLEQECADDPPADSWRIRFFADGGGIPGSELGPVGGQILDGDDLVTKVRQGPDSRFWDYEAQLSTPVTVTPNECYWTEISGLGEGSDGCRTYLVPGGPANRYSFFNRNNDGGYDVDEFEIVDLQFCLHLTGGMTTDGCGPIWSECCTCPAVCTPLTTAYECEAPEDGDPPGMGGVWHLGETCAVGEPLECPGVPCNDDCANAIVIAELDGAPDLQCNGPLRTACYGDQDCIDAGDGDMCGRYAEYNNICTTTDGGGTLSEGDCAGNGPNFHFDVWYEYTAESRGNFTVSSCGLVPFDQMIAIYDGSGGCTPTDDLACGDDTCGLAAGPAEVSVFVLYGGQPLLIRVGSNYDESQPSSNARGFGEILFHMDVW